MSVYVKPAAAFKKLEAAKLLRHNIYIFGATGFGKTELIKQFFKNEKYIYIPCRHNSCDLSAVSQKGTASAVVIDNVNAVDSPELRNSIKALCSRKNLWVIVSGRSRMPSWLFDTFITENMLLITENDLALTEEGIDKYMLSLIHI